MRQTQVAEFTATEASNADQTMSFQTFLTCVSDHESFHPWRDERTDAGADAAIFRIDYHPGLFVSVEVPALVSEMEIVGVKHRDLHKSFEVRNDQGSIVQLDQSR